jgi:hypothetical protein
MRSPVKRRLAVLSGAVALVASAILWSARVLGADPTTADCLAASESSLKSGNEHKLRAERSQLLVCAAASCPADIRRECVRRVDEVNAAIPTIIFEAKDGTGGDLSAVKVTIDGEVLAERLEGSAISIDPGEHTFVFETAGQSPVTKQFVIQEAQKDRREAIRFVTPATPLVSPQPAQPLASRSPAFLPPGETSQGLGAQKIFGIVAAGVGVVGLALGSAFGVMAMSDKSDAQSVCPRDPCGTQNGVSKWSDAGSAGNVSTALFVVGGIGLAAGAVLWFSAPSSGSTHVGFGPGGARVKGTW